MASSNFAEFSIGINQFIDADVPEAVLELTQKVSLDLLGKVVTRTPVKTGLARANWQTTLGTPATAQVDSLDKEGGTTIGDGSVVIARAQPFKAIWLTNNLDYILSLENGSSKQSPAGMVAVSLAEIQSVFD